MNSTDLVGLSVSVSYRDELIWFEGFDHSDLSQTTPIDPAQTHFRIASNSKPLTATIMGSLAEEGVINIDESIYKYVSSFPKKEFDFTLRQLASHRSGVRHYKKFESDNLDVLTISQGLDKFEKSDIKHIQGNAYLYSSYGYNLL